jgi:hypothetical protein
MASGLHHPLALAFTLTRPGQYWSQQGDEALLCLETFWRNDRWHLFFPHHRLFDLSKN